MDAGSLVFPLLILAVVLLMLRSQRSRSRQAQQLRTGLVPGARVLTTSGLIAYVAEVERDEVLLEVAHEVYCRYATAAVARVLPEENETVEGELEAEDRAEQPAVGSQAAGTPAADAPSKAPATGPSGVAARRATEPRPVAQAEQPGRS